MAKPNDYRSPMLIGDVWITPPMVAELSELTGVHAATVRRWLRAKKLPKATYQLLDLLQNGSIARIHRAWDGWKLCPRDGVLIPPNGSRPFAPGHLHAMQLNYQRISVLTADNRELRDQVRRLSARRNIDERDAVENNGGDPRDRQKRAGRAW